MIRRIGAAVLLLALLPSLVSSAPPPLLAAGTSGRSPATVARPAEPKQPLQSCSYDNAPFRLGPQRVVDPIGYPYGEVMAWSCADAQTAIDEFNTRLAAMQSQAAAYRAAHPIK